MDLKETVKSVLGTITPAPWRPPLKELALSLTDRIEILRGERDALTPPRRMWHLVTDPNLDFKGAGQAFKQFLEAECGLEQHETVLDVGCGIGRNAVPLIGHVREYHGFDIMPEAIEWCRKNITSRHPNFHFRHADVRNDAYNPEGRHTASEYRFPYNDDSFDLVFLTSVFTHLLPRDLENYLREIARVMKPGGRCVISFYLLNDTARENIQAGLAAFDFEHDTGGCFAEFADRPEAALAYEEERVRELYSECRLTIREPIKYGAWSRTRVQDQDIVLAFLHDGLPVAASE